MFNIQNIFDDICKRLPDYKFEDLVCDSKSSNKYIINVHWALYCENYLEGFHVPFVHRGLNDDIDYVIKRYSKCISKSTDNFLDWLTQDYKKRLRTNIRSNFDEIKNKK